MHGGSLRSEWERGSRQRKKPSLVKCAAGSGNRSASAAISTGVGLLRVVGKAFRLRCAAARRLRSGGRSFDIRGARLTSEFLTHAGKLILQRVTEGGEQADASHGDQRGDDDVLAHALTALAVDRMTATAFAP